MLEHLTTEGRNPASEAIDALSAIEIVRLMNGEDAKIAAAVGERSAEIAAAIEAVAARFRQGGRLIYMGAGTSGRLGVLDASECPPTFNTPHEQVVGLIAGGPPAILRAVEGAEDSVELGADDLRKLDLTARDCVVGIAASGRTPYVIGGLRYARQTGAFTIAFSCNATAAIAGEAELAINVVVGPEVISGSTRLKSGTATKLVLNMLTTGAMALVGKTYGNLMVDLRASNSKLRARSQRIVAELTGLDVEETQQLLTRCQGEVKTAVVASRRGVSADAARSLLAAANGQLRGALEFGSQHEDDKLAKAGAGDLLLGLDGGGTGVTALLARRTAGGGFEIIGRGSGGPANPQAVGFERSIAMLELSVEAAFRDAGLAVSPVASACLALAGAGRELERVKYQTWAARKRVADVFEQVHDALPVLAAGCDDGWGVAVIAGTGSFCFARNRAGETCRSGGWGHLIGDEGSGYKLALAGLQAAMQAADGRREPTLLLPRLLAHWQLEQPQDFVQAVYSSGKDRAEIASLAAIVTAVAEEGDAAAIALVDDAAAQLTNMVVAAAKRLGMAADPFPLAIAGSLLVKAKNVQRAFAEQLARRGLHVDRTTTVEEPALGAVRLASLARSALA